MLSDLTVLKAVGFFIMESVPIKTIAVFCGSSTGKDPEIVQACVKLAEVFTLQRLTMVYGGGNIGLMGILADEMLKRGGAVVGVIPQKLVDSELAHANLTQLHIVAGMHERKALMAKLSDAFIILPGGIGTMDEFFEIFTWFQLGYHHKPMALLNVRGFYDKLIGFLEHIILQGYFQIDLYKELIIEEHPGDLVKRILNHRK
jgi:uncharacterized protein (TIGR00730 family)